MELLAPAGSKNSLIAAINNGADAIYLGLQSFNARDKAENFNEQNIADFVNPCHLFNVKVYLTINTLIKNNEFSSLINLVNVAVMAKVDAFIIQDLGVAYVLRKAFPNIVMHASTQMGIHNLPGALVAKNLGFSRIVLSREATLEDIKQIHKNCDIEIEYFVQGALCVSFSGNCYFSSLCFGESGNRGRCLQPCRLCYTSSDNNQKINGGYLLSPNDLCLISRLKELKQAGVTSLKIEGRMRRAAYVAQSVLSYRRALDNANTNINAETLSLQKVFSRGEFNSGYYLDNLTPKKLINPLFQNHRGVKIGKVVGVEKFKDLNKITIKTEGHKMHAGDGIKFVADGFESSMGVGNVNVVANNVVEVFSKNIARVGCEVYLTLDAQMEQNLLNITKKLKVNATLIGKINESLILEFECNKAKVCVKSDQVLSMAKSAPATMEQVLESVARLNDTHFELNKFECKLENVFIPKSLLNDLRRKAAQKLEEKIIECYNQNLPSISFNKNFSLSPTPNPKFENNTYFVVDEFLTHKIPSNACVVLAPTQFNLEVINKLKNVYKNNKIFVMLPQVMRGEDVAAVNSVLNGLDKSDGLVANNIYGLSYAKNFRVVANYFLNSTNSFSCEVLKNFDVVDVVASIENNLTINSNCGIGYGGYPSLMTFCHCPYKTSYNYNDCKNCKFNGQLVLTNERGHSFRVRRTKVANCYFELVNDEERTDNAKFIDLRGRQC